MSRTVSGLPIRQIRARRRFKISTASAGVGVTLLVPIWAAIEYRNAGGWPARGFSQRTGTPGVWNIWIIYPFLAYALMTAGHGWFVYGRKPVSGNKIKREIERQARAQRRPLASGHSRPPGCASQLPVFRLWPGMTPALARHSAPSAC